VAVLSGRRFVGCGIRKVRLVPPRVEGAVKTNDVIQTDVRELRDTQRELLSSRGGGGE